MKGFSVILTKEKALWTKEEGPYSTVGLAIVVGRDFQKRDKEITFSIMDVETGELIVDNL